MADLLTEKPQKLERALLVGVQTDKMADGEAAELLLELQELVENLRIGVTRTVLVNLRLGQAINNLVDNALKYTPAGGRVTISARTEAGAAVITVTDNGSGVPIAEREAIFRRLYRSDASRSQRGLGLGLSLVKAIVESHGGTVTVDDAPGGGARFAVRLPR